MDVEKFPSTGGVADVGAYCIRPDGVVSYDYEF